MKAPSSVIPPQRAEIARGLWLDARGVAWLAAERILIAADVHLAYAWVQRRRGALLPLDPDNDAAIQLAAVARDYDPRQWVFLGDLVHAAAPLPGVEKAVTGLCRQLGAAAQLTVCLGNHDRRLPEMVDRWKLPLRTTDRLPVGAFVLCHGDEPAGEPEAFDLSAAGRITLIGHEHPCLVLGDGPAAAVRAPCALIAPDTVVLPAFSRWAAGCVLGRRPFLGAQARAARFTHAYACLGPRLLRWPLSPRSRARAG